MPYLQIAAVGWLVAWSSTNWQANPAWGESNQSVHWSFQQPKEPDLPNIARPAWLHNPIDYFVLARLERHRLAPSVSADRPTLLRRLSLDLLGLPPSLDQLAKFVEDSSPNAYEQLVDQLLASPHFGERWGRHWLDLVRFADGAGYDTDTRREHAWRYRQWVINSYNHDLPFDVFTRQQLAGDLLNDPSSDVLIATGMDCMTLSRSIREQELIRYREVIDRVNTTGTIWLGLSLGCAQCHDHKYDPIDQVEYYRFFAFFNNASSELADVTLKDGQTVKAHVMTSTPRTTHLHIRGQYNVLGTEPLQPHGLKSLHTFNPQQEVANRLDLANWILSDDNPLVARVTVNRTWRHLLGQALVRTPEEFGVQGSMPTHPVLLDWLARQYPNMQWSRKRLIHLIIHSATYRQASRWRKDLATIDPENKLLARQHRWRVEAEIVRDLPLAAAGILDFEMSGPSVFPPIPAELADFYIDGLNPPHWPKDRPADHFRRAVYINHQRNFPFPTLSTFDCPNFNKMVVERTISNSPLMALTALNDQTFFIAARGLARRVLTHFPNADPQEKLQNISQLCLGRKLTIPEASDLLAFFNRQRQAYQQNRAQAEKLVNWKVTTTTMDAAAAWVATARVFLNLDEFMTRQ